MITTEQLIKEMTECRKQTIGLLSQIEASLYFVLAHPEFSPIGWHLGHIAYTESLWLLKPEYQQNLGIKNPQSYFAVENLPKTNRVNLPDPDRILLYCQQVRELVLDTLGNQTENKLLAFLLQHESQHREIITFILHMMGQEVTGIPPEILQKRSVMLLLFHRENLYKGVMNFWALDNEQLPFNP
ncbi:MAG: hypothetical protein HC892_01700, partial [Saprospiraceae bacterium]|nr:hypothetical protein [Saprospiraceae bacterium]